MTDEYELIELYLNDKLDGKERDTVEQRIASDADFKEKVNNARSVLLAFDNLRVSESISAIYEAEDQTKRRNIRRIVWISGIAATLLIILTVSQFFSADVSGESLFARYFEPYPDYVSLRTDQVTELERGLEMYTKGNYDQAISLLRNANAAKKHSEDVIFYLGLSFLASGDAQSAVQTLEPFYRLQTIYQPQVRWYLSLSYLKLDQTERSINYLQDIGVGDFKYKEAQELLELLR